MICHLSRRGHASGGTGPAVGGTGPAVGGTGGTSFIVVENILWELNRNSIVLCS